LSIEFQSTINKVYQTITRKKGVCQEKLKDVENFLTVGAFNAEDWLG
jgi:hypothetical protein